MGAGGFPSAVVPRVRGGVFEDGGEVGAGLVGEGVFEGGGEGVGELVGGREGDGGEVVGGYVVSAIEAAGQPLLSSVGNSLVGTSFESGYR